MYIIESTDNLPIIIYQDDYLNEEEKDSALYVSELPVAENKEGYTSILKVDISEEKLWYDYEKIEPEPEPEPENDISLAEQILFENQYQTMLLEMGGGV